MSEQQFRLLRRGLTIEYVSLAWMTAHMGLPVGRISNRQ